MKELQKNKVISVIKHFPGHGATKQDSHNFLPIINKKIEDIENEDMYPFEQAIKNNADAILVGHLLIKNVTGIYRRRTDQGEEGDGHVAKGTCTALRAAAVDCRQNRGRGGGSEYAHPGKDRRGTADGNSCPPEGTPRHCLTGRFTVRAGRCFTGKGGAARKSSAEDRNIAPLNGAYERAGYGYFEICIEFNKRLLVFRRAAVVGGTVPEGIGRL